MTLLTIESTCDETAAAVISARGEVLGECIATQEKLHEQFRGVVPEVAARAHVERILPVIDTAMTQARVGGEDLTAIAVADRPGLAGSLLVGLVAAKTLALAWNKPLVTINHLHAHLYACNLQRGLIHVGDIDVGDIDVGDIHVGDIHVGDIDVGDIDVGDTDVSDGGDNDMSPIYPAIGLVVSGGHTSLYHCASPLELTYLGGTIDDAAGEAFDKVAAMLGLGFPGGPAVARWAAQGDSQAFAFPRSMLNDPSYNFSFSGLKTAVRYALVGPGHQDFANLDIDDVTKANVCASFEAAVVDVLVAKCKRAIRELRCPRLIVGGGVAMNLALRDALAVAAKQHEFALVLAPPNLCTDNAVMGALAWEKIKRGDFASLDQDIHPGLQRGF